MCFIKFYGVYMIVKKFSKTYDQALTQAYLFHSEFVIDNALFTAFSPIFATLFADDFLNLIEAADAISTNEEDLNNQVILSTQVEDQMEVARAIYQKLLVYIGIGWPNSETTLLAFGSNLYEKARKTPPKMMNLLQMAFKNASSTTYKTALIAAGFVQLEIDSLGTIEAELNTRYNAQQDYIQHSFKRTEERTVAFNSVWDEMVKISNASKLIFKDSPAKVEFYLLYSDTTPIGTLTTPQNFAFDPENSTFNWDIVANATSYEFESSTDGINFVEYWVGAETTCIYGTTPTTLMYFRVRGRNAGGYGPFSSVIEYNFTIPLTAPQNLQLNHPTSTFTWNAVPTATSYEFQYRNALLVPWVIINVGSSTSLYHVDPSGEYVTRVRAKRGSDLGPFSTELHYLIA